MCNFDVMKAYDKTRYDRIRQSLERLKFDQRSLDVICMLLTCRIIQIAQHMGLQTGFAPREDYLKEMYYPVSFGWHSTILYSAEFKKKLEVLRSLEVLVLKHRRLLTIYPLSLMV